MVVVQESVFQCNTRVIEQDAWTETEKALRVPRAVNIGRRFTARMQVVLQLGCQQTVKFPHKNEDSSESVSSFCTGAIFYPTLGYELSINGFVVSVHTF